MHMYKKSRRNLHLCRQIISRGMERLLNLSAKQGPLSCVKWRVHSSERKNRSPWQAEIIISSKQYSISYCNKYQLMSNLISRKSALCKRQKASTLVFITFKRKNYDKATLCQLSDILYHAAENEHLVDIIKQHLNAFTDKKKWKFFTLFHTLFINDRQFPEFSNNITADNNFYTRHQLITWNFVLENKTDKKQWRHKTILVYHINR